MKILIVTRGPILSRTIKKYFSRDYGIGNNYLAGRFGWFWGKALKELGHSIEFFVFYKSPLLDFCPDINLLVHRLKNRFSFMIRPRIALMNKSLIKRCLTAKPDLILIDAGELIYPQTLAEIKKRIRVKIVNWLLDDPFRQHWKNVVASFSLYDRLFVFDAHYLSRFKQEGASKIEYLPCAYDPDIYKPFALDEKESEQLGNDLCFSGTITRHRLEMLSQLSRFDLGIWSWNPGALRKIKSLSEKYRGRAWGEFLNRVFNASKIILNIHHPQSVWGVNMKTFEIAGSGGFQLVDKKKDIDNFFEAGKDIVTYETIDELSELIEYYLKHPQKRRDIADSAQRRVKEKHTYRQRLQSLISAVERL